ncbi:MAG: hypothetical protein QXT20_04345 [Candidatus Woesearchaeota archaeon]
MGYDVELYVPMSGLEHLVKLEATLRNATENLSLSKNILNLYKAGKNLEFTLLDNGSNFKINPKQPFIIIPYPSESEEYASKSEKFEYERNILLPEEKIVNITDFIGKIKIRGTVKVPKNVEEVEDILRVFNIFSLSISYIRFKDQNYHKGVRSLEEYKPAVVIVNPLNMLTVEYK